MADSLSLCTLILAGGQSSRMGQDKALLPVEGVPLLRRLYQVAQRCTGQVYVVTPWSDRYRPILPSSCQFIHETLTEPNGTPHGPLVGFAQGVAQVECDWVLLLACDLPYLTEAGLASGVQAIPSVPDHAIALLPRSSIGWEPLCGFYRHRCQGELMAFIAAGGRSFQRWLADHVVEEWAVGDRRILFNCNTPADLRSLDATPDIAPDKSDHWPPL